MPGELNMAKQFNYTTGEMDEVKILEDETTILWTETRLGWLPKDCYITGKVLWPFTRVAKKYLTYVAVNRPGMWHKCHFAKLDEAIIQNLKVNH